METDHKSNDGGYISFVSRAIMQEQRDLKSKHSF